MLRHGILLRLGFLTNNQTLLPFAKPRYLKSQINIIESFLKYQLTFSVRNLSVISGTQDELVAQDNASVNLPNDATMINSTLSRMVVELDKTEDEDLDNNSYQGKNWNNPQEKILYIELEKGNALSSSEWADLRERVFAAGRTINENNIDATIIGLCITFKRLATGRSYLNHLIESGQELKIATISKFFRLCFICCDEVDSDVQQLILSYYDSLRAKHAVFDASTAEHAVQGLAVTPRWKEGFDLLDEIKLSCSPNAFTYSTLCKGAFDNDETELGWELIANMLQDNRKPLLFVYEAWLKYAHRFAAGDRKVEEKLVSKLLDLFANNDIRLTEDMVKMVRLWYEYSSPVESNWNAEFTTVDPRGMCKSCHQYLRPIALSVQEFETLRSAFMSKAVVGSNVFLKSTPEELARYQDFVNKTAPYDIVIDGLNVAYSAGAAGKGNPRTYARMLQAVVAHFVDLNQKVLVLGRQHMNAWPRYNMSYVRDNAHMFLAEDLSQDDPYLLYAAMFSGLGTCFISRDLMRSHAFILSDTRLQGLFLRWQKQHQYQVLYVGEGGNVRMKHPLKYNTATQKTRHGGWHVPYDLDNITPRAQALNPPFQWLCLSQLSERDYDESSGRQKEFGSQRDGGFDSSYRNENRSFNSNSKRFDSDRDDRFVDSSYRKENRSFRSNPNRSNPRESYDSSAASSSQSSEARGKPRGKWHDDDSDDDERQVQSKPSANAAANDKKAYETYRKKQEVWSDDDSDDDDFTRPPSNASRQPGRKQASKTHAD